MKKVYLSFLIALCSYSFGQTWVDCQNANYVISGATLTAPGNGNFSPNDSTIFGNQSHFAIDPKHKFLYVVDPNGQRVLRFNYPVTKNQPKANLVYGQTSFNSTNGNTNQNSFIKPISATVDSMSGTLWVLDGGNNRVLRFDSAHKNTVNKPNADQVLGQTNFFSNTPGTSQSTFTIDIYSSTGNLLYYDHATGSLWVGDNSNYRVLLFNNAKSLPDGAPANIVLGQTNFTSNTPSCSASGFSTIVGITMIGNSLFVSAGFHRVLRFDNVYSKTNGAPADAVFGQTSFTTANAGCSATQMNFAMGITADNSKLYVCDWFNERILIFNSALTNTIASNALWANNVSSPGNYVCSPSSGLAPESITMDPVYKQLLIANTQHKRIMVYNAGVGTGIETNGSQNVFAQFLIYPNPTIGEFVISLNSVSEKTTFEIYNTLGQIIKRELIVDLKTKINLSEQANGIYFVKIIENGDAVYYSKIIKN